MRKKYGWRGIRYCLTLGIMVLVFLSAGSRAEARTDVTGLVTNRNASFVTWAPDYQAWTIDVDIPN